jgi:hypothetical protein
VLTENKEVVSAIMVPLGDHLRTRVCMPTKDSVNMGVSFVPLSGKGKRGKKQEDEKLG